MDIKRPAKSRLKKRIRAGIVVLMALTGVGGITFGLTKLKPAAPTLDRSSAVIDPVKRGQMLREVHGQGTLVPQLTRWVPAAADGRVEKVFVQAGVEVESETVIVELSNPQLEQQAMDAEFQVKAAQADEEKLRVRLESDNMTQQSAIATINADYSQAKLQLDTDEVLAKQLLVAELLLKISRVKVLDLANRLKVEQQRLAISGKSTKAQINAQDSRLQQLRALAKLKRDQVDALKVRASTKGVLQAWLVIGCVALRVAVNRWRWQYSRRATGCCSSTPSSWRSSPFSCEAKASGPVWARPGPSAQPSWVLADLGSGGWPPKPMNVASSLATASDIDDHESPPTP